MKSSELNTQKSITANRPVWVWAVAVGLTWLFWWTLWTGGGLVGGDVYSYSLPQKTFLADWLQAGVVPLWNHLTGHGYPVLGESQTGALYPLHLLVYRFCDVGTGWNVVLIVHYIAAFVAMAWCARRLGILGPGAMLAAIIYVYGWFPPRAFLDWAILGGVYLPLVLGSIERYIQTGEMRYAVILSVSIGVQLLGGHYQIAFLTWLVSGAYAAFRLATVALSRSDRNADPKKASSQDLQSGLGARGLISSENKSPAFSEMPGFFGCRASVVLASLKGTAGLGVAFLLGVSLAAPQLGSSWELKGRSQRATVGVDHDPAYGHIPPGYLTQIVAPWFWYAADLDIDAALQRLPLGQIAAGTNRVEAHCYFGLVPVVLLMAGGLLALRRRAVTGNDLFWVAVIVASLVYATGWLMPVLQGLPGFSYFRGPGRASILATLAVAILTGRVLDALLQQVDSRGLRRGLVAFTLIATTLDLWWTPTTVSYAVAVSHPPIAFREASPLRKMLLAEPDLVRLYAPGANLSNVLGVASTPVYLGFGPREYFDPQFTIPETDPPDFHAFTPERLQWLRDAGVTHILSFEPLEQRGWPVTGMWAERDPLLNRAWARPEPLYLYRINDAPGRFRWEDGGTGAVTVKEYSPHRIVGQVDAVTPGQLVLTDLADPGWTVTIDGTAVTSQTSGMYRSVSVPVGAHEVIWWYRPRSVYWGLVVSGAAAVILVLLAKRGRVLQRAPSP